MMKIPAELQLLLDDIKNDFPIILKNNLVGIYIWGSLTYSAFDENCSDVDLVIVTKKDICADEFSKLEIWFKKTIQKNTWMKRSEMRFVIENEYLDKTSNCCGFFFGEFSRHSSDGNPFIWINIYNSGITLFGKNAKLVAPNISDECLNNALLLELDYLKEGLEKNVGNRSDAAFKYNSYAVITACRILYTAHYRVLVSKEQALNWALKEMTHEWHSIISNAKTNRIENNGFTTEKLEKEAMNFVCYIENMTKRLFNEL